MASENQPEASSNLTPVSAEPPQGIQAELDRQRQKSARLLNDLAAAVHSRAGAVSHRAGSSVRWAAQKVEGAAHYLQEQPVSDWISDAGRLVRRNPGMSMAAAVVAGYMLGRALRRR